MARYSERFWQKPQFRHYLEFAAIWSIYAVMIRMPVNTASNLLGRIGRAIGPRLWLSDRVRENILHVWPDMPKDQMEKIVLGVWDNFSRVGNDYWNLDRIREDQDNRIEIVGDLQRRSGVELIMKGREGARRITQVLKASGNTIMLVDVRMNDGIKAPFLGVDAMTPSAPAALALKYDALLVPVRVERTGPAHFRVTVEEPTPPVNTGDRNADILATTTWINDRISAWVIDRPDQWMWFHRRWGKNPKRPD